MKEFAKAVLEILKECYPFVEWSYGSGLDAYYFDLNDCYLHSSILEKLKDFNFSVMIIDDSLTICLYC